MSRFNVKTISKDSFALGEGPHWCSRTNKLLFVDILGNFAGILDTQSGEFLKLFDCECSVTSVFPHEKDSNKIIFSTNQEIFSFDISTKERKRIAGIDDEQVRFNDAKCDSKGRLWIGTMGMEISPGVVVPENGALYKLSDGKLEIIMEKVSLSNGICWSHDDKTMFYIDSTKRLIYAFDYDSQNGTTGNRRILTDMNTGDSFQEKELPDGMTIDIEGNLWVAMFNGGRIVCLDSKTGSQLDEIKMPTSLITSVCFGGSELREMFVTSCKKFLSEEQQKAQPEAGKIFRITSPNNPKFRGFKPNYNFQ